MIAEAGTCLQDGMESQGILASMVISQAGDAYSQQMARLMLNVI